MLNKLRPGECSCSGPILPAPVIERSSIPLSEPSCIAVDSPNRPGATLQGMGYNVAHLDGGISAWNAEGRPEWGRSIPVRLPYPYSLRLASRVNHRLEAGNPA